MIAFDLATLTTHERDRLLALLRARPLVSDPAPVRDPDLSLISWVALLAPATALVRLDIVADGGRTIFERGLALSVAVSVAVLSVCWALAWSRAQRRRARAEHPIGRFLHPFGLVRATVDRVEIVEGAEIAATMLAPAPRRGERGVAVWLTTHDGEVLGIEGEGHGLRRADVDAIRGRRLASSDGYRGSVPLVRGTAPRERARARLDVALPIALALFAGLATQLAVVPALALGAATARPQPIPLLAEVARELPWAGDRASKAIAIAKRAEIPRRLAQPYAAAVLDWATRAGVPALRVDVAQDRCTIDPNDAAAIRRWLVSRDRADAAIPAFEWAMRTGERGDVLHPAISTDLSGAPIDAPTLDVVCEAYPVGFVDLDFAGTTVARLRVEVRWTLRLPTGERIERSTIISPPSPAAMREAGLRHYDGHASPADAALALWRRHVREALEREVAGSIRARE